MASDQLELFRFVTTLGSLDVLPLGAPDGIPDVDASRILYIGESFGAVLGATALALGPEAHAACLTVGGDDLSLIMRDSSTPGTRSTMRSTSRSAPSTACPAGAAPTSCCRK